MTPDALASILARADAKQPVDAIAAAEGVTPGYVYTLLRKHRPARERKPRERTSDMPAKIKALHATGAKPGRIAELLDCSKAYVYRHIGDSSEKLS